MKIRGHGNAVAIALAGLAVVLAATGTAYAVATTKVTITDPNTSSRYVKIDSSGHLSTVGAVSSLNTLTFVNVTTTTASPITSPTTATLIVTRMAYYNPGLNSGTAHTNFAMSLVKINVGADGTCFAADSVTATTYTRNYVGVGSSTAENYASPLVVRPTGTKKYCLGIVTVASDPGGNPTSYWNPSAQFTGYVSSGTYTGVGIASSPAAVTSTPRTTPHTTPKNPHPAGVGQR